CSSAPALENGVQIYDAQYECLVTKVALPLQFLAPLPRCAPAPENGMPICAPMLASRSRLIHWHNSMPLTAGRYLLGSV
ncbi:MAG: hypothetical protein AAF622_07365, partial [Cyanobacteria bacterium P01_C01_bin.147]